MKKFRSHKDSDRYAFDFGECSISNGFAQIDTKQDAWYFGNWANPFKRFIVSYCEGDVTVTICDTDEEFVAEMREIERWNTETGWGPAKVDPGADHDAPLGAKFEELGLGDMLH